jgi:putative membrane protein
MKTFFTSDEKKRIEQAVKQAEKSTSGEIVPYFVESSDLYEHAVWRGSIFLAGFTLVIMLILTKTWSLNFNPSHFWFSAYLLAAAAIGFVMTKYIPSLRKLFTGKEFTEKRVRQRATQAFMEEEIFNTRERTGILIFVSYFEHKVVVMGDSGINEKVEPHEWEAVVELLTLGIKMRKPADGMIAAIQQCGKLLERRKVLIREDDTNEISDSLREGK